MNVNKIIKFIQKNIFNFNDLPRIVKTVMVFIYKDFFLINYVVKIGLFLKLPIFMNKREISTIKEFLNKKDYMLEWGAGGSTTYFSLYVKKYISIEHNKEWYEIVNRKVSKKVDLYLVENDLPRTIPTKKEQFKNYINFVNKLGIPLFNKVLIDGRARNFCAIEVLPYLNKDSIVFIHDFYKRQRYHSVLKYYNKIYEIKSDKGLIVLSPKSKYISYKNEIK